MNEEENQISAFNFHYPHNDKTIEIISSRIFTPDGVNAC
jgi:hypothetical protein